MKFYAGHGKERIGYDFFCDVATRIVEGRKRKNWRQEDLSKASGISMSRISDMENVKIRFTLDDVEKLSKALDVSADWLIDAQLDHHGKECLYLVWKEGVEDFKMYRRATSARRAYLRAYAWSREVKIRWFEPRDRAIVELVGVPVEQAELDAKFPKHSGNGDDAIEPDKGGPEHV